MDEHLSNEEVWSNFRAAFNELRARDQIAGTWWSASDIDGKFDALLKKHECPDMEEHRHRFRRVALARIGAALARDAAFNNKVQRELSDWFKEQLALRGAPTLQDDDWRGFFHDLIDDQPLVGTPAP